MQMGGPEGVQKKEQYTLVTGIEGGLWMHAVPRYIPPGHINGNAPVHISTYGASNPCHISNGVHP